MDYSLPGSSVHGTLQARILEWVAIPFSKRSSRPRDQTLVSCITGEFFTIWATREAPHMYIPVCLSHLFIFFIYSSVDGQTKYVQCSWRRSYFRKHFWSWWYLNWAWENEKGLNKDESEVAQSCLTLCNPMDCSLSGSSIHGIFHFFLQGIFPTQELNPGLPHCRQTLYCLSHQESPWIKVGYDGLWQKAKVQVGPMCLGTGWESRSAAE